MADSTRGGIEDYALLADEAERGDLQMVPGATEVASEYAMKRGRPERGVPRDASVSYTVRVPSTMGDALNSFATAHHLTASDVVRAALGVYLTEQAAEARRVDH